MKNILRFFLVTVVIFSSYIFLSANDLELTREFNLITSKNAGGYLKPLFTTIGEGLNTSLYNTSYHSNGWSFGINLSVSGMIIPKSQLDYDAELPDLYGNSARVKTAQLKNGTLFENLTGHTKQPTIYGGASSAIFATSQSSFPPDSFYKSVGFLEGNDISIMPALPIAQFYIGIPTRTELRLRFLTFGVQGAPIVYYTVGINQNIDKTFGINEPDNPFSLGFTAAYHSISRNNGIDISSLGLGLTASQQFGENFNFYGGVLYENMSGDINFVRKNFNPNDVLNSPYSEIRNGEDLKVSVESFNSFRATLGAAFDVSFLKFHGDISYAAQPVFNFGVSIKLLEHKELFFRQKEYHILDELDRINVQPLPVAFDLYVQPQVLSGIHIATLQRKTWRFEIDFSMKALTENKVATLDSIIIEEFESRQTRAILPYIFFGENESFIPDKYHAISKQETNDFNYNQLSGKTPLESYYDILNVIGYRMRQKTGATISITGTNNNLGAERNNTKLSRERAETVMNYLVDVWDIEPTRITIEARNLPRVPSNNRTIDGQEENRRVEISSIDLDITAPVFIIDTILRIHPDIVRYLPVVRSEAGLESWSITSTSSAQELRSYAGGSRIEGSFDWNILNEVKNLRANQGKMITKFTAKDTKENELDLVLEHPIKVISVKDKRFNATKDTSLNIYNLILFDFDKSSINASNKRITDFIISELTPDTEITIFGYTDRIGDENYNMRLSTARAESTGQSLGGYPYKVVGLGESKLIYNNDLPEGRFYSRTVVVETKVPIN